MYAAGRGPEGSYLQLLVRCWRKQVETGCAAHYRLTVMTRTPSSFGKSHGVVLAELDRSDLLFYSLVSEHEF
jgi:hypothetical protein